MGVRCRHRDGEGLHVHCGPESRERNLQGHGSPVRPLLLLLALAFANGAYASTYTIVFTVPSTNSYVEGDSVFYCDGGGPTDDLAQVRFMRQDVIGGQPLAFDSLGRRRMGGEEDSLHGEMGPGPPGFADPRGGVGDGACRCPWGFPSG